MPERPKGHTVESKWREADAVALDERVTAISDWLEHTEDLVNMFKHEERIAAELRGAAGSLRTRRNDFSSEAAGLRAELKDE